MVSFTGSVSSNSEALMIRLCSDLNWKKHIIFHFQPNSWGSFFSAPGFSADCSFHTYQPNYDLPSYEFHLHKPILASVTSPFCWSWKLVEQANRKQDLAFSICSQTVWKCWQKWVRRSVKLRNYSERLYLNVGHVLSFSAVYTQVKWIHIYLEDINDIFCHIYKSASSFSSSHIQPVMSVCLVPFELAS